MRSSASFQLTRWNTPCALGAAAHGGIAQPVVAVDAPVEPPDLGADVARRHRVGRAAVDGRDPAALHRDLERARVGAVERTRRLHGGFGRSDAGADGHAPSYRHVFCGVAGAGHRSAACSSAVAGVASCSHECRPACRHRRRRVRRSGRGAGAAPRAGARDAGRPPQSSRLPAAALPGGDGRAVAGRYRRADPLDPPPAEQRAGAARRGRARRRGGAADRASRRRAAVLRLRSSSPPG